MYGRSMESERWEVRGGRLGPGPDGWRQRRAVELGVVEGWTREAERDEREQREQRPGAARTPHTPATNTSLSTSTTACNTGSQYSHLDQDAKASEGV